MPKASEIKKNNTVVFDGKTCIVRDIERSVPQGRAGGSIYRIHRLNVQALGDFRSHLIHWLHFVHPLQCVS